MPTSARPLYFLRPFVGAGFYPARPYAHLVNSVGDDAYIGPLYRTHVKPPVIANQ